MIEQFKQQYRDIYLSMVNCEHNSPYHQEGSVWAHTEMVYNYAVKNYPDNKIVQLAALLHDIGKPSAMKVDPRDNKIRFSGHEGISTFLAREILDNPLSQVHLESLNKFLSETSLN